MSKRYISCFYEPRKIEWKSKPKIVCKVADWSGTRHMKEEEVGWEAKQNIWNLSGKKWEENKETQTQELAKRRRSRPYLSKARKTGRLQLMK